MTQPNQTYEKYVGPTKIDCAEKCDVPEGVKLAEVPRPRHAWGDVLPCPNCGRCFLLIPAEVADVG